MSLPADTIAAISTPPGPGAIGILRLSGPEAVSAASAASSPSGAEYSQIVPESAWLPTRIRILFTRS